MGRGVLYFVTAKHVLKTLADREICFFVNRVGGTVTAIEVEPGNTWWTHPTDPTADVAVIGIPYNPVVDIGSVQVDQFGTRERLAELNIGIGDEIFAAGLFTKAAGTTKNFPIVRHGNIAMMPDEQIETDLGYTDVYLVEMRSLGGLSGSPVFVRPTINTRISEQRGGVKNSFSMGHAGTLLGLIHGHWDVKESEMNKASFMNDRKHGVNYGIAIVVPAIKILETINRPELVKIRMEAERELLKGSIPSMDVGDLKA